MDRLQLLAQVPLFQGLATADRTSLAAKMAERHVEPGQLVFAQGEPGASMFIVVSGGVQIFLSAAHQPASVGTERRRLLLKAVDPGDYFGELAFLDDKPRSASAEATSATVLSRAREILANLEAQELDDAGRPALAAGAGSQSGPLRRGQRRGQLGLFGAPQPGLAQAEPGPAQAESGPAQAESGPAQLAESLRKLDLARTTPLDALLFLHEAQRRLK